MAINQCVDQCAGGLISDSKWVFRSKFRQYRVQLGFLMKVLACLKTMVTLSKTVKVALNIVQLGCDER